MSSLQPEITPLAISLFAGNRNLPRSRREVGPLRVREDVWEITRESDKQGEDKEIPMSTQPKPSYSLYAKYLGPILSFQGELTKHDQNLIFARNGTGKSFLSRAFRYLDLHGQGKLVENAARNLVSDESPDGKGEFKFSRGPQELGSLQLEKDGNGFTPNSPETIFHVFSEDFVHHELRERLFEIDGEIENQIAVDSENIKLKDAQASLEKANKDKDTASKAFEDQFNKEKNSNLCEKAGINKQLREYRSSTLAEILANYDDKPSPPEQSFPDLLKDLDSLKSIPAEPNYPESVDSAHADDIDLKTIETALGRITSPSSVSGEIKEKIDAHHSFFETGASIVQDGHGESCPFCEQDITSSDPKEVIDAYLRYFSDEEEKRKTELRGYYSSLKQKTRELEQLETMLARQRTRYDKLRQYVPSKKATELQDLDDDLLTAKTTISGIQGAITEKAQNLGVAKDLPTQNLDEQIARINKKIDSNNAKAEELNSAIEKSDEERKSLQRKACAVFEVEFASSNWGMIESLNSLRDKAKLRASELAALEKASPSTEARTRVAETFEQFLQEFFGTKYSFEKESFTLKRESHDMVRGPDRTLSDGEKTAIAFCYFVASIHRKVSTNSDYQKLFLVFDDPVTSMSYDFVFTIAQALKNLTISNQGEVSQNPGLVIDGNNRIRPELLILTHSSYFFNILLTNKVVKCNGAFSLYIDGGSHRMSALSKYVSPFQEQLREIYEIANGRDPDHATGNTIRSVLEAIGRFCRPDKSENLTSFLQFLAGEDGIKLKSVLINSLSHGTYYDPTPPPDDLKLACQETVQVVEKYAKGQLEVIKHSIGVEEQ